MKSNASIGSTRPRSKKQDPLEFEGFVDDYLPALLAQASFLISSEFHKVVRKQHLSVSEWRVLATLASLPPGEDCSMSRLARISLNKQPTLTRLLDRMVLAGYVERHDDEADRRITLVRINKTGRALVQRLMEEAREHEKKVLEPLGSEGLHLKATLRRIIELHQ